MSDTGLLLVGCCCFFLLILVGIGVYLYNVKGIRTSNYNLAACAFSNTPLVGTWTSTTDLATITLVGTSYTVALKSLTGTAISSTPGCTLTNETLTIPSIGTAVLKDLTLTLTKTVGGNVIYTKTAC